ncbi:50S ribosomal protein L23 [Candidatus Nomurabacteria bacterium RIFCSPLOWO2_02_FULL_44_12]|uniref:Large ribosomal subunit protein uL23 n=1 Tax=Candidatus Nomurabacteria bacterium RIFCSPLOWO2_12_FULL_44_11 TaxID=1801796 RepID=A0A1F6Y6C7_9BACT|nr:MAG: 50S ribosomal protein L23 [Candidatus Nomurabacteria bacterium RIFCSPHIGHO2_12_FULL_44_22b]OGJ01940.1 MAG: 50S ribosomal protein L23 [Candidatus Nomurabacteria bacterium RIFCSPLOWO2_12_FULL_44_11]OGJ08597.1 MAG: 50S ribosomal protein L23 [Candidatus Nomurabacteria bacterium RIFCSPLOWO2_02_FULL_44_12]
MNQIIKNPRITEKASNLLEGNVYTFDVADKASKNEIRKAIFAIYKVKPVRVNVAKVPKKNTKVRGVPFTKGGGRKALVYLKEGDKIEFI